jgi:ATP-binding cassette subfamily F protein 3
MLDEPTNNLDLLATLWLEDWLSSFSKKSMLIVVSHDISFINSFATDVVLLTDKNLFFYQGNYTTFAQARSNEMLNKERQQERTEMHRAHIEKFVTRFRYNANRAALVQSRIKTLDKMVDIQLSREKMESFEFPQAWEDTYEHNHFDPLVELK